MTAPKFSKEQIHSLLIQGDSNLAHDLEKVDLHFCVRNGVVHFEAVPSEHDLEVVIEEKETVDGEGLIQSRVLRHKDKN